MWTSGLFNPSLSYILPWGRVLHMSPELSDFTNLSSKLALGILSLPPAHCGHRRATIPTAYVCAGLTAEQF